MPKPTENDFRRAGLAFRCCEACHEEGDTGEHLAWIQAPGGRGESWPVCCRCAHAFSLRTRAERRVIWARATHQEDQPDQAAPYGTVTQPDQRRDT